MTSTFLDNIAPSDLGLPTAYPQFRDVQRRIVEFGLYGMGGELGGERGAELGPKRWHGIGAAPGCGKTLASHTLGLMSGSKYAVLTATRTLEDQNVRDLGNCIVNVRGRSNYTCAELDPETGNRQTCEQGAERGCRSAGKPGECEYARAVRCAAECQTGVVTNYQYWMHARAHNQGALQRDVDPIRMLVCDEAHLLGNALSQFLGTWVGDQDLKRYAGPTYLEVLKTTGGREWGRVDQVWALMLELVLAGIQTRIAQIVEAYDGLAVIAQRQSKEYQRLKRLEGNVGRVCAHADDGNWLWRLTRAGVSFECVWPGRYAERYLWSGVERVVLLSATLRPKALQLLGLRPGDYWFTELPRVFPAALSPVYWVATGKMGMAAGEAGKEKSIERGDQIMDEWMVEREGVALCGIIHTPSYKLAEWLYAKSRHARNMILSEPGDANTAAEKFRKAEGEGRGVALIAPSFMTGWDFPAPRKGSWQWIPKLPFADKSDPVTSTRAEADEQIYDYDCMQGLVQACGRRVRKEDQRCVTMITDDAVRNFRNYARNSAPGWFKVLDAPGTVYRADKSVWAPVPKRVVGEG